MVERLLVLARVLVGRRVAATDVAAVEAHSEVDPFAARLQTFLAAGDLVRHVQDLEAFEVFAPRHGFLLFCNPNSGYFVVIFTRVHCVVFIRPSRRRLSCRHPSRDYRG